MYILSSIWRCTGVTPQLDEDNTILAPPNIKAPVAPMVIYCFFGVLKIHYKILLQQ